MDMSENELKKMGQRYGLPAGGVNREAEEVDPDQERFLENMNATPIGSLLKIIASLPEVRYEKIASIRRELDDGRYNIGDSLDEAIDRVLEELIADG
jgi:hypothetical protein